MSRLIMTVFWRFRFQSVLCAVRCGSLSLGASFKVYCRWVTERNTQFPPKEHPYCCIDAVFWYVFATVSREWKKRSKYLQYMHVSDITNRQGLLNVFHNLRWWRWWIQRQINPFIIFRLFCFSRCDKCVEFRYL